MNEIVKYHNNLNKIQLPSFTEQEQNILFTILHKVQNKNTESIRLFREDILQGIEFQSWEHLTQVIDSVKNKFFKANFQYIVETQTTIIDTTINLFKKMEIHYTKRNPNDGHDKSKLFLHIDLQVNEEFEYILNKITANFTRFELAEFINISGKYAKTLYRLLKQYRSTGFLKIEWAEFIRIMDIPECYNMCDIEKQILRPAIKELTKERTLFDSRRIPFENLQYKKIKGNGRGRGGNVIGIEFSYTPQIKEAQELTKEQQPQINNQQEAEQFIKQNYIGRSMALHNSETNEMEMIKIESIIEQQGDLYVSLRNADTWHLFNMKFNSTNDFKSYFEKNKI